MPAPGVMVRLSPKFNPPILKGIKTHTDNPFKFDFILDKGDSNQSDAQLKDESSKLIKYFLASLTIPEKDLWVNLSPYEKNRIIPDSFGLTEMGRDLLAEDYMLKQITASLIYPEDEIGKKFWKRVYEEAEKKYGSSNIPVNTFNKVWIVPEKAVVYENAKAGAAYVVESKLKVMLEQDFLALSKNTRTDTQVTEGNQLGSQIVHEIVIPELTKEVNSGQNFIQLRQVYNSLILAAWYKKKIKDSILSQVYSDKNKVAGVNIDNPQEKEKIYQHYLQAFKKGAYNYIKEEIDPITKETIPRKYFSGGAEFTDMAMASALEIKDAAQVKDLPTSTHDLMVSARLQDAGYLDKAMVGAKLRSKEDDDVIVSVKGLTPYFRNGGEKVAEFNSYFSLPDPEDNSKNTYKIKGVSFEKVMSGYKKAWSFKNQQLQKVSNLTRLPLLDKNIREIAKDEVAISVFGLKKRYKNGDRWKEEIKNFFGLDAAEKQGKKIHKSHGIQFEWVISGNRFVWAFKEAEVKHIGELMGMYLRDETIRPIGEDEISASAPGLMDVFESGAMRINEFKEFFSLSEPNESDKNTYKSHRIQFTKVQNGSKLVWSFKKSDLERISKLTGIPLLIGVFRQIKDDEVAVSPNGLGEVFTNGQKFVNKLREFFSLDKAEEKHQIIYKNKGITFERVLNRSRFVWSFNRKDIQTIGEKLEIPLKKDIRSIKNDEIVISRRGLEIFERIKVEDFKNFFGLDQAEQLKKTVHQSQGITFEFVVNGNHPVWCFNQASVPLISKLTGYELKKDVDLIIEKEGLESIVSDLNDNPQMLMAYLLLTTNLDPNVIGQITRRSFEGFQGLDDEDINFEHYENIEGGLILVSPVSETSESSIFLEGEVKGNFDQIQIKGSRNRVADVDKEGRFRIKIILRPGEDLHLIAFPFNAENQTFGRSTKIDIKQTGKPKNLEQIILELLNTKSEVVDKLTKDPVKLAYLRKRLEVSLLNHFTENEKAGFVYLERKIKSLKEASPIRKLYEVIKDKFELIASINEEVEGLKNGEHMYFYQKYTFYEISEAMRKAKKDKKQIPAIVIALEQGLGKTLIALAIAHSEQEGSLVVAPNAVVPVWAEQDGHFFDRPKAMPIYGSSRDKTTQLAEACVTHPTSSSQRTELLPPSAINFFQSTH